MVSLTIRRALDRLFATARAILGEPLTKGLRRRLRAAAPSTIAELREGLHCRIAGSVRIHDGLTIEAPLTGRPCVMYLLEVVETTGQQRDLIVYDRRAVPFLVAEAGYHAIVDPTYVELLLTTGHEVTTTVGRLAEPRLVAVLDRYCPNRLTWDMSSELHFREVIIKADQRIAVAGVGQREADPVTQAERGYRDHSQERLRFVGSKGLPLLIGD